MHMTSVRTQLSQPPPLRFVERQLSRLMERMPMLPLLLV